MTVIQTDIKTDRGMDGMAKSWPERYMNRQTDWAEKRNGGHIIGQRKECIYALTNR
jgi:hypothetical protein